MRHALNVLLVGRPGQILTQVQTLLAGQRQLLVTTRELVANEALPIPDLQAACDAIVLVAGEDWRGTLDACFRPGFTAKKPLLVIGPATDLDLMRMSMRIGARDIIPLPVDATDLIPALDRVAAEEYDRHGALLSRVTTFMNAKGGSGASFCAANFAHILAKGEGRRTVLLDFELQFGSLPTYFNLQSRNGLVRALELVDTLDATALQAYTQQHPSGLYLLASAAEGMVLPEDIHEERVAKLFAILDDAYEDLVIDLPRRIDRATAAVLDRSDLIMLVVQQTVAHFHELKRLAALLRGELGIASNRLIVVINRFEKRGEVTLKDFTEALPGLRVETLPNDYRHVAESINLGIPLLDLAPGSPLCKALKTLVELLSMSAAQQVPRPLGRWSWLVGKLT